MGWGGVGITKDHLGGALGCKDNFRGNLGGLGGRAHFPEFPKIIQNVDSDFLFAIFCEHAKNLWRCLLCFLTPGGVPTLTRETFKKFVG